MAPAKTELIRELRMILVFRNTTLMRGFFCFFSFIPRIIPISARARRRKVLSGLSVPSLLTMFEMLTVSTQKPPNRIPPKISISEGFSVALFSWRF
jgi:hypothetical protein